MRGLTNYAFGVLLLLISIINQVSSTAKFELELTDYINMNNHDNEGHCCSGFRKSDGQCSEECRTKFRVCLNVYQVVIDPNTPCAFGEIFTPVIGGKKVLDFSAVNPMQFDVATWQTTFSLVIEAWHDNNGTNSYAGPVLLHRLMTQGELDVDHHWSHGGSQESEQSSSISYRYRVVCQEHYYGSDCRKYCRPRDDDFGHYECDSLGQRQCLPGWLPGEDGYCLSPICEESCVEGQGVCVAPNQCRCVHGYTGERCESCEKYPGCKHGTCSKAWECNCNEGWGGHFCNQDLNFCTNHKPCKNGATCFNTSPGSYSCECPTGFRGTNCEIRNHTCATNPCKNGGTCLDTGEGHFVCQCPTGYSGSYCHISGKTCADRPCLNGGMCKDTEDGFQCTCRSGFEGESCRNESNDCESNPCFNGGSCVDERLGFRCVCPTGFTGAQCEENIDDCSHMPCYNGGICIDSINAFSCQCKPGYSGNLCEINIDACGKSPCSNGGTCFQSSNDFRCHCSPQWKGRYCTEPRTFVSACNSSPCINGGSCSDALELSSGYRCSCPSGLIGPNCNVKTAGLSLDLNIDTHKPNKGMPRTQIVLIVLVSCFVPLVTAFFCTLIICIRRRKRREERKQNEQNIRQNEQNLIHSAINNKSLENHMIINSLDYPQKPINTDTQYNQLPNVLYPTGKTSPESSSKQNLSKKAVENAYESVKSRSTKTLNTDSSRLSLASRLEKELDCGRRTNEDLSYCKTPDPSCNSNYSQHTLNSRCSREEAQSCTSTSSSNYNVNNLTNNNSNYHNNIIHHLSSNNCPSVHNVNIINNSISRGPTPSTTCTTPSSIYVIDEHLDDAFIATEV